LSEKALLFVLFKEFEGNKDRFSIVSHKLKTRIIALYVRINPLEYHLWISLRADFYGCKSGTELSAAESVAVAATFEIAVVFVVVVVLVVEVVLAVVEVTIMVMAVLVLTIVIVVVALTAVVVVVVLVAVVGVLV